MLFDITKLKVTITPMKNGEFTIVDYSYIDNKELIGSIDVQIENELYRTHKGKVAVNLLGKLKDYIRSV